MKVAVVRTGLSNLGSMIRALEECGADVTLADSAAAVTAADRVVLPGVGAFGEGMARLRALGLDDALRSHVAHERPLLGVCLGMQMLADHGEEMDGAEGLGLIPGRVVELQPADSERVPHMGWNEVTPTRATPLMQDITDRADFYFVHSFHFVPSNDSDVLARTPFAGGFVSMVGRGLCFGAQFHPEKSSRAGARLLANFLAA